MAECAVALGALYVSKKVYKWHTRDSDPVTPGKQQTSPQPCSSINVGVQQQYGAGAIPATFYGSPRNDRIYQYLCWATLQQLLAMLVDGVYSRDRKAMDLPGWFEGVYKEDERAEIYSSNWYWKRMYEISDEEERKVGLRHYLRYEPNDFGNKWHKRYRLVIALRGTKLSSIRDLVDDIKVAHHTLNCSSRYRATKLLIDKILAVFHSRYNGAVSEVCITGHSLGSAIALSIGKDLAKDPSRRYAVHCFNPPFLSVLMLVQKFAFYGRLKNYLKSWGCIEPVLQAGGVAKQVLKLGLACIMFADRSKLAEEFRHFKSLIDWIPVLYVNQGDMVCKEYQRFYDWKNRCFLHLGLPIPMQALVSKIVKRNANYSSLLVPSVDMYISKSQDHWHNLKPWYTNSYLQIDPKIEYRLLPDHADFSFGCMLSDAINELIERFLSVQTRMRSLRSEVYPARTNSSAQSETYRDCLENDADLFLDEEILPGSAEAFVLESDIPPQPVYDHRSGNMQQRFYPGESSR